MKYTTLPSQQDNGPLFSAEDARRLAHQQVEGTAQRNRDRLLEVLRERPRTADEACAAIGLDILSGRPRLAELHKAGLIVETGQGKSSRGNAAAIWRPA